MWVLTRAINEYDQDGDYFESAWIKKPNIEQLIWFGFEKDYALHLLNNDGGRIEYEHTWWFLTELKEGEQYKHSNSKAF